MRGEGVSMDTEEQDEERSWISKEIDRQIEKAEERGDALPVYSGLMSAFFGRD